MFGLDLLDDDDVFDSDAELSIFVESRLIRYHISRGECNLGELHTGADANWAFVNVQERPDAVTRAVPVI